MKKQLELAVFLKQIGAGACSYNEDYKDRFHKLAMAALGELERSLGFRTSERHFNSGGVAVSGDAVLRGMWEEGKGAYVHINNDMSAPYGDFYFRAIVGMNDFCGKANYWAKFDELGTQKLVDRILKVKED